MKKNKEEMTPVTIPYDYISNSDCIEGMKAMPSNCVDIIIADPIRFDLICSNQIQVKMLLAEKNGEHMFLKTYKISDEQEKILQDMKDWMEKILDGKRD